MKRFLIGYALLTTCLLFMQQKPLLVYHADSKHQIAGKVEEKRKIGSLFTITVNGNVFVVSEERFKKVEIGCLKNLGYDFDECFELAYQEIKDRKGRWIDGSFVKEEDLLDDSKI